jgi:hypothetical protein
MEIAESDLHKRLRRSNAKRIPKGSVVGLLGPVKCGAVLLFNSGPRGDHIILAFHALQSDECDAAAPAAPGEKSK